jgi:hypothetical protein
MGRSDNDYQEELREHIAMETQANIDRGMSPEDAARAARITFGSVTGTRQQLNEGRPAYWRETLAQDFRYALRTIRRNLLLSCTVVLTLSLGLGFTTAVFRMPSRLTLLSASIRIPLRWSSTTDPTPKDESSACPNMNAFAPKPSRFVNWPYGLKCSS